jgi:hypothetical protein
MVAITCYYDDGECAKIDITDLKTLKDLKNKIYTHKFKSNISNLDDIVLITFAEIIKDSDEFSFTENQVVLVKITIDIEFNKFIKDVRFIKLVGDDKKRKMLYKILENPDLLESLETYKYQKELDQIKSMNFVVADDKIKKLLDTYSGNIENVINTII